MRISFVTLFPEMVTGAIRHSILKRAEDAGIVTFDTVNPRDFADDPRRTVDDTPYGGGPGMVMRPDVAGKAIESVVTEGAAVVFTDPAGETFNQMRSSELTKFKHVIFLCGHYEGMDERIAEKFATHRYSIGDYVLTGGELPACVMADAVVRQLPGVLGSKSSLEQDAFVDGLLTNPQYTRPELWEGLQVPEILLSGDHAKIEKWRRQNRLKATRIMRPDLFARAPLSKEDMELLQ